MWLGETAGVEEPLSSWKLAVLLVFQGQDSRKSLACGMKFKGVPKTQQDKSYFNVVSFKM